MTKKDILKLQKETVLFEAEYGSAELCKIALNSVTKILVEKGLITQDELRDKFKIELKAYKSR